MPSLPSFLKLRSKAEKTATQIPDLKTAAIKTAFHVLQGHNPQRKAGSGETFWQFREYQPGDTPGSIDWRQSAKTDRVYVREKEQHKAQSCLFWCKQNDDMAFHSHAKLPTKHFAAAHIALSLALLQTRAGEMVGYSDALRPGHSEKTLQKFEHILMDSNEAALPAQIASAIPKNATLTLISDFLEPIEEVEKTFSALSGRTQNVWVIQVLDPAEIDLPYKGRVIFENNVGHDRTAIQNVTDIRDAYKDRVENHNAALRTLSEKQGWHYILHRTDQAAESTIREIWNTQERLAMRGL